jgi:hypothetical protein
MSLKHTVSQGGNLPREILPRDRAGKIEFPQVNGHIKHMLGLDGFMEIYAVNATYRLKTADHLDPKRTVPDMPGAQSVHALVGSSSPFIARIVIQSVEALGNWPLRNGNRETIKHHLHACKEDALICDAAYRRLKTPYDAAVALVVEHKVPIKNRTIESPSLPTLRDDATAFLTSAKRALQSIGEVFNQFYAPDGKKPKVGNANFEFAIERLEKSVPINQGLVDYLKKTVPVAKRFVDLRNGLEHPNSNDLTVIEDFHPTPSGFNPPSWHRGALVAQTSILDDMNYFLDFLLCFCEAVFFHCLIDNIAVKIPFQVVPMPESKIDPECPVHYRVEPVFAQGP